MSTDQFDAEQIVRIRLVVEIVVWSDRMPRRIAEVDVAGGPEHLAFEHGDGNKVVAAKIVPWTFD